jgi:hypothetical protein
MNSQPRGVRWTYLDFAAQLVRVRFHFRRPPALPRPSCVSRVRTHSHIHARMRTHAGAYAHACTRAYTHTHARARTRAPMRARPGARVCMCTPRRRTALDGQRRRETLRNLHACNPHGHVTLDAPQVHSCTHMHARTGVGRRRRLHREAAIGIRANGRLCRGMDERADLQTHTQTKQRQITGWTGGRESDGGAGRDTRARGIAPDGRKPSCAAVLASIRVYACAIARARVLERVRVCAPARRTRRGSRRNRRPCRRRSP